MNKRLMEMAEEYSTEIQWDWTSVQDAFLAGAVAGIKMSAEIVNEYTYEGDDVTEGRGILSKILNLTDPEPKPAGENK